MANDRRSPNFRLAVSSTLLDQIVTPALFYKFGRKVYEHEDAANRQEVVFD